MKFYHGSPNGNLKKLTMDKANHGAIFLAEDYCFAVMYAGNGLRFWETQEDGKLIIREVAENGLELLYKDKPCYIYSVDESQLKDYKKSEYLRRKTIEVTYDVDLDEVEFIPNVLEKILQLEKEGKLVVRRWETLTQEQQTKEKEGIINKFITGMQIEHDKFPEEYKLLITMFPELKLENINKEIK